MKAFVMNGPDGRWSHGTAMVNAAAGDVSLADVRSVALRNLEGITGAPGRWDEQGGAPPHVAAFRNRNLDVLALIDNAYPGATDEELAQVFIRDVFQPIGAKKKGGGDLAEMWEKVRPALEKAGNDVLGNEVVQTVTRNNPVLAAARMAFQITVQENVGGIADMMVGNEKTTAHVKKVWEGMGGKWSNLQQAIAKGQAKGRKGKMGALPPLWDVQAWRGLSALDLVRESVPYGLDPSLFPGMYGVDQYGDVEEDRPRSGDGGKVKGSGLAGVLKAAGPIIDTVLNAFGTKPPAEVKALTDAAKDGETAGISKEVLNALLQAGLGVGKDILRDKLGFPIPQPSQPPSGRRIAPIRRIPVKLKAGVFSPRRPSGGSSYVIPALILGAAVYLSKQNN